MKPVLQAILVADHVYEDRATGKKIVAGIFHRILVNRRPMEEVVQKADGTKKVLVAGGLHSGSPYAYISLTEVRGPVPFVLRYVFLDEDQVLLETKFTIEARDPLHPVEAVLPLPRLPADRVGTYALELLHEDEPLGMFRIIVEEMQPGGTSP